MILFNFNSGVEIFNFVDQEDFSKHLENDTLIDIVSPQVPNVVALVFRSGKILGINLKTLEIHFSLETSSKIISTTFSKLPTESPLLLTSTDQG